MTKIAGQKIRPAHFIYRTKCDCINYQSPLLQNNIVTSLTHI
jgi:hypothetical protein